MKQNTISDHESGAADPMSWESWLKENASKLLLFARQQSRTEEDAEDILQESLIRLARKEAAGEFIGGQEAGLPYIYTSIRRLAVDYGRKEDRRTKREEFGQDLQDVTDYPDPWLMSEAGDDELRELVEAQLKKIPQKFSEVIILKIWGEQTFQQIADTLGISLNTVASRYRYGLDMLRKAISHRRDDF